MINCKKPNNGGNVLVKRDNKIILLDQSLNEISSIELPEMPDISGKLDISKAEEEYAHSLSIDGNTLKLMNNESTPAVLSSVDLPEPSGSASKYAHAMILYNRSTSDPQILSTFDSSGVHIVGKNSTSTTIKFEVALDDPTKYHFKTTSKSIYYRYYGYNSSYYRYSLANDQAYAGRCVQPSSETENYSAEFDYDWQVYSDDVIVEVFAELVEV